MHTSLVPIGRLPKRPCAPWAPKWQRRLVRKSPQTRSLFLSATARTAHLPARHVRGSRRRARMLRRRTLLQMKDTRSVFSSTTTVPPPVNRRITLTRSLHAKRGHRDPWSTDAGDTSLAPASPQATHRCTAGILTSSLRRPPMPITTPTDEARLTRHLRAAPRVHHGWPGTRSRACACACGCGAPVIARVPQQVLLQDELVVKRDGALAQAQHAHERQRARDGHR